MIGRDDREAFLDYMARCDQAFRPFAPINLPEFLRGRRTHIETLQRELAAAGRQVAIYGERGVGKTSLANVAWYFARISEERSYLARCEQGSTYETIFGELLRQAGMTYLPGDREDEVSYDGGLGAGIVSASRKKVTRSTSVSLESTRSIRPALLLERFAKEDGLLIIDEYDRVRDVGTHTRLAETIKHFSDGDSRTKIIVVGVAETLTELIGQHQSLTRSLAQIRLERMSPQELEEIVSTGERRVGIIFEPAIRRRIIALSDGFPYYTHLLCKYASEEAGKILRSNPNARVVVSDRDYRKALESAIETAEESLIHAYQEAVITVKRKTDMFRNVLWAIAYADSTEVQVREIAENIGQLTGKTPPVEALNNYLGPLVKRDKGEILERVRQGYYRYANPLMRAYVRLNLERHSIFDRGGQLRFPWMHEEV